MNKAIFLPKYIARATIRQVPVTLQLACSFHTSPPRLGFEEFVEVKKTNEIVSTGRGWTVPDLRRKSFDDLHKLWFVLYKERNLLLTEREKIRRAQRPITGHEERRYMKVKRGMAAIKIVLEERKKITNKLSPPVPVATVEVESAQSSN